jgi:hypothetical protein
VTPLAQIAPRLHKLLLMLSSDEPGEVINAARAIGRALRNIGADWHDLVAGLNVPHATTDWRSMRDFCGRHDDALNERERNFIADLAHWHGTPSEKQLAWLTSIHARLRRAA